MSRDTKRAAYSDFLFDCFLAVVVLVPYVLILGTFAWIEDTWSDYQRLRARLQRIHEAK